MKYKIWMPAVIFVAALSGCASPASTTPSSSPAASEAPAPEPTPTPEEPTAASVRVSTEAVEILDAEGEVLESFEYFDDETAPIVEALTEAFDSEPVVENVDGGVHPSWTEHTWGGFAVWDYTTGKWDGSAFPETNAFRVVIQSAEENGIDIETKEGISVGDDAADVAAVSFRDHVDTGGTKDVHFFSLDRVYIEPKVDKGDDDFRYFATSAWVEPTDDKVYRIDLPSRNWGH